LIGRLIGSVVVPLALERVDEEVRAVRGCTVPLEGPKRVWP